MDKNLINIDDLVRQRLGGMEEQERSGAWGRMRDLLDAEEPKRPFGLFFSRRLLSSVAALLLVATVSVGSYEASSYYRNATGNGAAVAPIAASDLHSKNANNVAGNQSAMKAAVAGNTANDKPVPEPGAIKQARVKETAVKTHDAGHNHKKTEQGSALAANEPDNKNSEKSNRMTLAANTTGIHAAHSKTSTTPVEETSIAAATKKTGDVVSKKAETIKADNKSAVVSNLPEKDAPIDHSATNNVNAKDAASESALNSKTPEKHANTVAAAVPIVAAKNSRSHKAATAKLATSKATVLNNKATNNEAPEVAEKVASKSKNAKMEKLALGGAAINTKDKAGLDANKLIDENSLTNTADESKTGNAKSNSITKVPAHKSKKSVAGSNPMQQHQAPIASGDNKEEEKVSANNGSMKKKVIERMVVYQHYIKTAKNEGHYNLDTISRESLETLIQEPGTAAKRNPAESVAEKNSVAASSNGNAPATAEIVPAASASKAEMGIKENTAAKKSTGAATLQKLSAAFNDLKYSVGGMQFAPGLTAGINGTFFGPNSFKGFQFGVTGSFIFGDNVSILSELKYFHRINSDYSLSDNYYTYTPAAGGGYTKQLQLKSYDFSTLHSIELPVSVRYRVGNFDVFAGGNFVYTFSINTDAAPAQPDPANIMQSSIQGNDNSPKLNYDDFNSRFSIGYLLGLSYHISSNVLIDLRNVQSVWDNAKSSGSKFVSEQLYKSPSLQLSIGYRLGNNKAKDKE